MNPKQNPLGEKFEDLSLSTPDILQVSIALRKAVKRVVSLAASAHKSAERIDAVLAGVAAVLVNVADGDLHRGVVIGLDDAVGSAAFAGDVASSIVSLLFFSKFQRGISTRGDRQIDNLSLFVLHFG